MERFPAPVRDFFSSARMEETPGAKPVPEAVPPDISRGATSALRAMLRPSATTAIPQDPLGFSTLSLDTLLSSHDLVNAARDYAHQLGYHVVIDNTCDDWPCEAASLYLIRRMVELRARHPRLCLISSGEVTVRLPGRSVDGSTAAKIGVGGRNQQFALASAFVLAGEGDQLSLEAHSFLNAVNGGDADRRSRWVSGQDSVCVFSAGTDGVDGNSPVAGAIADLTTLARARALHFDPLDSLRNFDACPLFRALGDTVVTGKTGHNLRDLRLLLYAPAT
jgi:hydroxypyruvate reductase